MTNREANPPPVRSGRPSANELFSRAAAGTAYLAILSLFLAELAETNFLFVFVVVFITLMFEFALFLTLAAGWALRAPRPRFQLRLSSIFLVVAMVAIYLAGIRRIVAAAGLSGQLPLSGWLGTCILGLIFMALSIPYVLLLGEAMLWAAVWLVRRPPLASWLRRFGRRRG